MTDAPSLPPNAGAPSYRGDELARAVGGRTIVSGSSHIRGGAVDSRKVVPGNVFFALPGERTDGHRFLVDAVAAGAACLVVRDAPTAETSFEMGAAGLLTVLQVPDVLAALLAASAAWRDRFDPLVIGVTGSLAKTSTKEQIAEVLAERWTVLRNEGNENNEVGLPLTMLRLLPEHEVAVLEMGMYVETDIATLARAARPRIGVVTAVRGTHLTRAGSLDAIERGKGELVEALPRDGTAILNADDQRVARMRERTSASVLTYGFSPDADVTAHDIEALGEQGMRFALRTPGGGTMVTSLALGRHSVHNALAAAAVGIRAGLDVETIARGLARAVRAPHRTSFIRAGDWRILDDSYNAAPDSMVAALDLLASLGGHRVAVLGEMLELGDGTVEAHREVGRHAASTVDRLVVIGEGAAGIADGARASGMDAASIDLVLDRDAARDLLLRTLRPEDAVLLKASRGVALDVLAEALIAAGSGPKRA